MSEVIGDAACIAANVAAFAVFQCAFFYLFASKTYDHIVKDKLHIASEVLRDDRLGKTAICNAMLPDRPEELHAAIAEGKREQQRCARENRLVLAKWCGPFVGAFALGAAALVLVALRRKVWRPRHNLTVALLVLCFSTELAYYVSVIRTYQVLGDWQLFLKVFDQMFEL